MSGFLLSKFCRFYKFKGKVATLHGLGVVLAIMGGATSALAATGNNWNDKPSWMSSLDSDDSAPPHRRGSSVSRGERSRNFSPFVPGSNNLAIEVGQIFLMGDLSSNFEDSLGTAVNYTYGVSDIFGFNAALGYSNHAGGKLSMTSLKSGLRLNLSWYDKVIPYIAFGLGFYRPSYMVNATDSNSPVLFGVHVGPGVDLEISRDLFFGAALTFHDMFNSVKIAPGKSLGGTYTSFFLHLGTTF
jgi:hypothetical protein